MERTLDKTKISLSSILLGNLDINGRRLPSNVHQPLEKLGIQFNKLSKYSGGILSFSTQPLKALNLILKAFSTKPTPETEDLQLQITALSKTDQYTPIQLKRLLFIDLGKAVLSKDYEKFSKLFTSAKNQALALQLVGYHYYNLGKNNER